VPIFLRALLTEKRGPRMAKGEKGKLRLRMGHPVTRKFLPKEPARWY